MKHKITTFVALAIFNLAALAEDSSKFTLEKKPLFIVHSSVVSLQPAIITDAECNKVFSDSSELVPALHGQDVRLKFYDQINRKIQYKYISDELTTRYVSSKVIIHLPGKKTLISPSLTSGQLDNKTHEFKGQFFNDYCRGNYQLKH